MLHECVPPFNGMKCSVSFTRSAFVTAVKCVLRLAAAQPCTAQTLRPPLSAARPWKLGSFYFLPHLLFSSPHFSPTSGSSNPKLKVNRSCWPPSSIPGCKSKDLECQRQRGGKEQRARGERRPEEEDGTKHNFSWPAPFQTRVCS